MHNTLEGWDVRYDPETLGADPGENNLSRCRSKTFRGCKDRFVNRAARVTGDGTNRTPGQ